jgi:hypothetical protein
MNPIRHAGPALTVAITSARSRDTRLARAAAFSVAVLFGAVGCADSSTAPLAPTELEYIESSTSADEKNQGKLPEGEPIVSFSRSSLSPSLSASAALDAPSYSVLRITHAPESRSGLQQLPGSDDFTYGGTAGLDIGFNFTFFGQTYDKFFLSSNGLLFFGFIEAGAGVAQSIPLNDAPTSQIPRPRNNLIAFLWSDFVALPGQISYGVRGTAPNRRLIIDYNQVGFFQCTGCPPTTQKATTQAILYEGSNVIEMHTASMVNPGRFVTQGIENRFGTEAFFLPGRVRAGYHLANDGVRFTPPPAANAAPVALAGGNAGEDPSKHYAGVEGDAVAFAGSAFDADGDALSYSWDFDNDGNVDATTLEASFTYADNGTHSALLKVSDGRGGVAESRVDVVIANADPVVKEGTDVRIKAGETVSFSGTFRDKGANDALWSWTRDFGSLGSYSNKAESQAEAILGSKRFCKAGIFPVKLTVVDKDGGSGSDEMLVTVDAQPIEIDINPNSINLNDNGHGMITVRIYSREGLDATALRPDAIRLTGASGSGTPLATTGGQLHWSSVDLNGDGRLDVSAGFRRDELIANRDLTQRTAELTLLGEVGNCGDVLGKAPVNVKEKGR